VDDVPIDGDAHVLTTAVGMKAFALRSQRRRRLRAPWRVEAS